MRNILRTYCPPEQISHREPQSNFTWEIRKNVLVIVDLDLGNKSVTNDIHRIWRYIREQIGIIAFDDLKAVIYRDSDGYFDGVICYADWTHYYSLSRNMNGVWIRERNMKIAIRTVLEKSKISPLEIFTRSL